MGRVMLLQTGKERRDATVEQNNGSVDCCILGSLERWSTYELSAEDVADATV